MAEESAAVTEPTVCRNCGSPAGPRYCGSCGQEVNERRAPLIGLVAELLDEWFALDGRLARTFVALLRPGRLTDLFLAGKRAPYLRPIRLYLLASLLLFSSILALQPPKADEVNLYVGGTLVTGSEPVPGRPRIGILSRDTGLLRPVAGDVEGTIARLRSLPPQEVVDSFFNGLRQVLPLALMLFALVFALVLKLLYLRTRILYVDHLVFAIHVQSALFLVLAAVWLGTRVLALGTFRSLLAEALAAFVILLVYTGAAQRRVYRQSWLAIIPKTVVLLLSYAFLLQVAIGLSVLLVIVRMAPRP